MAAEDRVNRRFSEQDTRLDGVMERLESVSDALSELVERSLTPYEKECQEYAEASDIALSDVQQWTQGQEVSLISCSYSFPSAVAIIDSFEYKHDHTDESQPTEKGVIVRGFRRASPFEDEEWKPYSFLAREKDCVESTGGTIHRRRLC